MLHYPAMKISHYNRSFELYFLILFIILAVGTPLVFTSLTRSVFEVNKLLLLRGVTIFTCLGWIVKSVIDRANLPPGEPKPKLWTSIGLEIPVALFVLFNILSTVFSQNVRLSVIGAYDRWEGIATALNYIVLFIMTAKLVTKRYQMKWVIAAFLVPCALSAVYGVAQSLGYDFMQWSVDPTKRVFACINNPVHYCAYMGMMVPVGISALLYVTTQLSHHASKRWIQGFLFFMIALIFYAQYLSFSRATWFGFALSLPIYFMVILGLIRTEKSDQLVTDFFVSLLGLFMFYMYYIFNFHTKSVSVALAITTLVASALVVTYGVSRRYYGKSFFSARESVIPLIGTLGLFFGFIFNWGELSSWIVWVGRLIGAAVFLATVVYAKDDQEEYLARLVIFAIFSTIQFIALSFANMGLFVVLLIGFYWTNLRGNMNIAAENKRWLFAILVSFTLAVAAPAVPELYHTLVTPPVATQPGATTESVGLGAVDNVQMKLEAYKHDALKGSARVSMWKSSVGWIKQYWLLGSGLDTIKFMYPDFRRSDYGILEGGHNFTPDRLHNEYLNNLATRGIIGSAIYYFGIILGWYLIVLRGMVKLNKSPMKFFSLAFMTGATVYLGQVLFNFGVVATMVLFYSFVGVSWAISVHDDYLNEVGEGL